jgi:hypothetical protein
VSEVRRATGARRRDAGPPRWQDPQLDEAALDVARRTRLVVEALRGAGHDRWVAFLEPLVPAFEDGDRVDLQAAARRARAAFGARDSLLDALPDTDTVRLRDAVDRLLLLVERRRAIGG